MPALLEPCSGRSEHGRRPRLLNRRSKWEGNSAPLQRGASCFRWESCCYSPWVRARVRRVLLTLHKLDHDAFRHADEGQTQARITGQRANGDLGTLGAQVLDGGVHIIGRQTVMLQ